MADTAYLIDRAKLRRIALASQGLVQREPFGRGRAATLRAIRHLGQVQIDTISVVVRAHNHVLRTRVPNFEPPHIDRLLRDRQIFEYRFPVASFRPVEDFRFALPFMRWRRSKPRTREDKEMMKRVLERVRDEGPLRSRDFEDPRESRQGWWDWKPAKRALEQLFYQGDLMISARDGFQKSYDLKERVLPSSVDASEPTAEELASHLIDNTLRAHGFASQKSFAYNGRGIPVHRPVKVELERRRAAGELLEFSDDIGGRWWSEPETLEPQVPRARKIAQILSPFDSAIIQRERALKIFDFDYKIECYVPEPQRHFGYFSMPILYADRLVGRMDCKSHRDDARFEVKALFLEPDFDDRKSALPLIDALAVAIVEYARFDGCDEVVVTESQPAFARQLLRKAIRAATDS